MYVIYRNGSHSSLHQALPDDRIDNQRIFDTFEEARRALLVYLHKELQDLDRNIQYIRLMSPF